MTHTSPVSTDLTATHAIYSDLGGWVPVVVVAEIGEMVEIELRGHPENTRHKLLPKRDVQRL